jgi:hypothetical protein
MKFFPPELYVRYCSPDPAVASAAEDEWERAIRRCNRHYKKIKPELPESVRDFLDKQCLHDAEVFAPARLPQPALPGSREDVILVTQNVNTLIPASLNTLITLQYAVTEEPLVETPVASDVFHQANPIWLYDEFDVLENGVFSHEILLSTGRVLTIRFRAFRFQVASLVAKIRDTGLRDSTKAASA